MSQLIKSQALTLSGENSFSGFSGELESTNSKAFWEGDKSVIVGDATNNGDNAIIDFSFSFGWFLLILGKNSYDSGQ